MGTPDSQSGNRVVEDARKAVSAHLRAERARMGWKQADLANESGLSTYTINRLETGKQEIKLDHIVLLATAFGVSMGDFLDDAQARMRKKPTDRDA
ncbi:helix-turn-helix domain-containing protein [Nocardia cyriacigeorgica]|uniref:helix-turn-helix domain-containing protein n=1 Tax=Nocardia cyriacigeorgica TaxID=135487 RepID=UPI001893E877|nr:helix-turn-helix transcriptional regulator [Nocardia cyriacigeorgica]MBF6416905.1 helix-turn-helix transcriptional regulator [Nocardia cyriacigeorgica]